MNQAVEGSVKNEIIESNFYLIIKSIVSWICLP